MTIAQDIDGLIERIRALDPSLRAFIDVDEAGARTAAADSDRRIADETARALEGVPVAIKANIDVAGLETSAGIEARRGMIAVTDADAVARLRAAGAVILGTLNMHEAALGADTDNPWFGRAFNPHGEGRTPGGSSGGSGAAVAASLCTAALGTDTLGSVRIPAAYCGIYGLKPTRGAVSQQGLELVVADFDTIGPLARSLDDLEALFRVIADAEPAKPITHIGLLKDLGGVRCEPAVLAAYERALAALRAEGFTPEERLDLELKPIRLAGFIRSSLELGERLAPLAAEKPEGLSDSLKFLLDYGKQRSATEVAESEALLVKARDAVVAAVGDGALLLPTAPQAAFAQGGRAPANQADFTALASIAGLPGIAIPAGIDADGMPVGVQLVGAAGNEIGLIALARRLEPHLGGTIPPAKFQGRHPMRIIVLFNLKPGVEPAAYETWARATDIPGVRALKSVDDFQVYRATGLFGSDAKPPYRYFETIDINGVDAFVGDVTSEAVQKVAAEFRQFADNPLFITTEAL